MQTRNWLALIGINIIVSALVVVTVLMVWSRVHQPETTCPTPIVALPTTAAPVPTARPVGSPTPTGPVFYTVQPGDTLLAIARAYGVTLEALMEANGITDPNLLHVGQTLVIPTGPLPTATASPVPAPGEDVPTPLPTLTPSGPPQVEIGQVLGSGDLAMEMVVVRNRGGMVNLEGWTLSNATGNVFIFPALTLFPDTQVRVHSAAGESTPSDLYWGRTSPAWSGGELLTLSDRSGAVVDTYVVP